MFEIAELCGVVRPSRCVVATADDFEGAKAKAARLYRIEFMSDDTDYPGCADFITSEGVVGSIQPEGFTINDPETSALFASLIAEAQS